MEQLSTYYLIIIESNLWPKFQLEEEENNYVETKETIKLQNPELPFTHIRPTASMLHEIFWTELLPTTCSPSKVNAWYNEICSAAK